MPPIKHDDPRPFLTVVAWPEGLDRNEFAEMLFLSADLDEPTTRLRLGREPPMIVGQVDTAAARAAVRSILDFGGDAFAPTLDDLAALGGTLKIRDLRLARGDIEIDLWRGLSTTIRRDQVQILVRAHLRSTERRPPVVRPGPVYAGLGVNPYFGDVSAVAGIAAGGALAFRAAYLANAGSLGERRLSTSDKLDIHTTDGSVYQIDGDKFAYGILGDLRGHGDKANMDSMCELLGHLAPDEVLDPFFPLWHPPPGYERLRLPGMKINGDDPAFAFYSRWAALLYRHVLAPGGDAPPGR